MARNPWLAALVLAAFGARALVPIGFMPGHGGLALCPGHMAVSHIDAHAAHGSSGHAAPERGVPNSCPYAAAAATMAGGHVDVPGVAPAVDAKVILLPVLSFVPRGTIVPTRLPRGPPSLPA